MVKRMEAWVARRMIFVNGIKRMIRNSLLLYRSGLFDGKWYKQQKPNLAKSRMPAFLHYVWNGCVDDPCRDFCAKEYLYLNPDVARARIPAVLHYIQYGKATGRHTSFPESRKPVVFPEGTKEFSVHFSERTHVHHRVAVFASYSGNGEVAPYNFHYLEALRKCCDAICFVSDSPLYEKEQETLRDRVNGMTAIRHGEYDFGSYRRGWEWLLQHEMLLPNDEFVFCNDSCYAPFYPLEQVFETMSGKHCDFWGLTSLNLWHNRSQMVRGHLQSYFLVMSEKVHTSDTFHSFMTSIEKLPPPVRENVVVRYEIEFTSILEDAGFTWKAYIPNEVSDRLGNLIYKGATLIEKYNMPLLKVKPYFYVKQAEKPKRIMSAAQKANPALHADIHDRYLNRVTSEKRKAKSAKLYPVDLHKHQASFRERVQKIQSRIQNRQCVRVTFLVSSANLFPSRPLLTAMEEDPVFETSILVISGLPVFSDQYEELEMELNQHHPKTRTANAKLSDEFNYWHDVAENSDIVVYNTPYSSFHPFYNPRYAYYCDFLPVIFNYGYYRSIYDIGVLKMDNYAYFWKAFFENDALLELYRNHSVIQGSNGHVTGYCKMDALPAYRKNLPAETPCLLIAPHHSIEGGLNNVLGLSNFLNYEEFFLQLPERYPGMFFIFRPHPALFTVLSSPKHWGKEKTESWKNQFLSHPNVRWSDKGNYFQDFADSDAMLHDCGSFLPEYLYTGKPFCFMLKSEANITEKFLEFGQKCLEQGYIAYNIANIINFIDDVVFKKHDPLLEQRKQFSATHVMIHYPNAAQKALEHIKAALDV